MSSKRKSPPTKLDGTNGVSDLSVHNDSSLSHTHPNIKSESNSEIYEQSRLSPLNESQMNVEVLKVKRRSEADNFHHNSHSLQNILSKRRKSENFTNDNVPSLSLSPSQQDLLKSCNNNNNNSNNNNVSPHHHHMNESANFVNRIKREQNGSDGEFDERSYNNNNNNNSEIDMKKDLMVPSKKTMNDVLKLLTNKMRGSSLKDSRKSSVDGEGEGKSESPFDPVKLLNQVEIPDNLQEREKYYLYSEMILQLQMARDHLLRQQSEKPMNTFDNNKLHHDLLLAQKSLPFPIPENLDELALQKESFLQELQNQMANKSPSKRSSPQAGSPVLGTPIAPSPLIPFLPYLQTPYVPIPHDASSAPWNLSQNLMKTDNEHEKHKNDVHHDTPLNLTKKTKSNDDQSFIRMQNDGNNNTNKNQNHDHHASSSKAPHQNQPRLPYNLSSDDPDFFAACRLWPVMAAAAAQHNSGTNNQNLGMMGATGSQRDAMMMNEANFIGLNDVSKQKRDVSNIGLTGDEKVRMVRQQGRSRNSADRDLIGKS
ncbi:hypothetical protein ACKWTF_013942 [Chironomus riparius]